MSLALVSDQPKRMGRRSKYAPEVVAKITQAIRLGATYERAANYAGITVKTFYLWEAKYPDFLHAIKEAEGAATVGWLAKIEQAANAGQWQAAAWKLERRYPKDYGRTIQEHTGPDGGPIPIGVVPLDYRAAIAPLAPGPVGHRLAPGEDESLGDGAAVG